MSKVRIKQIRSTIRRPQQQKDIIKALGLGKINRIAEHELNPQIAGMIRKVEHLVQTEYL
ncbi:MAG: 50S ribosomal protein L30 [Microscillaceae bacterium]